ncbi:hypothetical protein GW765_03040 [Candidatus Parcubacteria bacterium]|nr:hypothetical protein [Candidatus Parcubacteria bacterium]
MKTTTRSQLRHSTELLNNFEYSGRAKPVVSPDYIVGLTDGEGCFYVLVRPPYNRNGGAMVQLNFFIKVKQKDKEILERVRDALDCGAVYFQHEMRSNHTQCYRYTVNSHRDIFGKIIPFFEKYPLQTNSKQKTFCVFYEIAELVRSGAHHAKDGIEKIQRLKKEMNRRTGLA